MDAGLISTAGTPDDIICSWKSERLSQAERRMRGEVMDVRLSRTGSPGGREQLLRRRVRREK